MSQIHLPVEIPEKIQDGLQLLNITRDPGMTEKLVKYLELLDEWNSAYNLTAIRDTEQMVSYHILDSLSVLPFLRGNHCLDMGTGAGLPGLILAIAEPARHWVLMDSNHKKIRFVNHTLQVLDIGNAETVCQRVEDYRPVSLFTTIITRAYGSLGKIIRNTLHLVLPDGRLLAMKGPNVSAEMQNLENCTENVQILPHTLSVPGIPEDRWLLEICPLTVSK